VGSEMCIRDRSKNVKRKINVILFQLSAYFKNFQTDSRTKSFLISKKMNRELL